MIYVLGGGANLNFKIVGGTTPPASPKENTIWVNTSTTISEWVFSAEQPTNPVAGMVWFRTGTSATAEFNALKKNNITVYPNACQQYIGSAWVTKTAKTYQNGAWKDWSYIAVPNTGLTWVYSTGSSVNNTSSKTVIDTSVTTASTATAYFSVNLSSYSKMKIVGTVTESDGGGGDIVLQLGLFSNTSLSSFATGFSTTTKNETHTVNNIYDISSLSETYYFGYRFYKSSGSSQYTSTCTITALEFY